jgi:hypothetical protein
MNTRSGRLRALLVSLAVILTLGLAFVAYFRPVFIVDLANRWFLCW